MNGDNKRAYYINIDYRGKQRKGIAISSATEVNLQQKLYFCSTKI